MGVFGPQFTVSHAGLGVIANFKGDGCSADKDFARAKVQWDRVDPAFKK